ncbi:unnamed protein product [Candida verbasci]|uniref:GABA-specific permease n=1 Tax=Candida verbasci TaxID=1227364 RepID=A0A9W4XEW7_9ASCO|nr:unnamed protein product [Candida verbasci]
MASTSREIPGEGLSNILSNRSGHIRYIDPTNNAGDEDLLAQIGYKQELNRKYSTLQVFGIAFSIMGLLPSISSTVILGLECGTGGLVWGWLVAGLFIFCVGFSLSVLGSAIPTSGGLFYYANYYCPEKVRVPLSFIVGCSNTLGLTSGFMSILYGFSVQILAVVSIASDGTFEITNPKIYGVFVAGVVFATVITCISTKHGAWLQTISIVVNVFLVLLFLIAVPVGVSRRGYGFNNASFIFGNFENFRQYPTGFSFILALTPAVWTIGAYDSAIHCAEEARNAQRAIPWGILGSITACWVIGWIICIVFAACIQDGDVLRMITTDTGSPVSQLIYDALGKEWAMAFMSLIAFGQMLMAISIMIALSRQVWSFARDDGLPIVYKYVKYIDPRIKVPIRASMFAGCLATAIGMLILIPGYAGAGALFSLAIISQSLSFATGVFLIMVTKHGANVFKPGPFYFGKKIVNTVHVITLVWTAAIVLVAMFPDDVPANKESMNYAVVVNVGVWILSFIYYLIHGHKAYSGPKSNISDEYLAEHDIEIREEHHVEKS